jgi:glutathione synthase/RimK-type ligase-like ATP-grasp enzyme
MIIGFMRTYIQPTFMAELSAILCKNQGMELVYMRPWDVDVENNTVKGKVYLDNKWVNVETEIPAFIDVTSYCYKPKFKKQMDYLRKNTFLSDDRSNRITKEKLQQMLKDDGEFDHLLIPTQRIRQFSDIEEFMTKHPAVVMKPIYGQRGQGVYVLRKEDDHYILGYLTRDEKLNHKQLKKFFEETLKGNGYIIQKYVTSRSLQGDPFDCRIHVEKNGQGKWVSARNFIRIGIGQKVISNVNQGGGIGDPEPFLRANFGDKWEEINQKLNNLALTLPYKVEELRKTHMMSMGMDIGIDRDGELYLFEVNSAPTTDPLKAEAAILRTNYYKYIIDNKLYERKNRVGTLVKN